MHPWSTRTSKASNARLGTVCKTAAVASSDSANFGRRLAMTPKGTLNMSPTATA